MTTRTPFDASSRAIALPMPLEAPVTTAVFILFCCSAIYVISSPESPRSVAASSQLRADFFGLFPGTDMIHFYIFVDLAHKTGKRLSRADLHESIHAFPDHGLHALFPANGRTYLLHKKIFYLAGIRDHFGVYIGHIGNAKRRSRDAVQYLFQFFSCRNHHGGMERTADIQGQDSSGSRLFQRLRSLLYPFCLSGDNDLSRAVIVGDGYAVYIFDGIQIGRAS